MAHQHLTLHEIRALDCPKIRETFNDDLIVGGVRSLLLKRIKVIDGMCVLYVFVFAYLSYEDQLVPSLPALKRVYQDYRHWVRTRTFPNYMGALFKKYLEDQAAKVA